MKKVMYTLFSMVMLLIVFSAGEIKVEASKKEPIRIDVDYRVKIGKNGGVLYYYDTTIYENSFLNYFEDEKEAEKAIKKFIKIRKNVDKDSYEYLSGLYDDYVKVKKIYKKENVIYKITENFRGLEADEYGELSEGRNYTNRMAKKSMYSGVLNNRSQYCVTKDNMYIKTTLKSMSKYAVSHIKNQAVDIENVIKKDVKDCKINVKFSYIVQMPKKVKRSNGKIQKSNPKIVAYDYTYEGNLEDAYNISYKNYLKYDSIYASTDGKSMKKLKKLYNKKIKQDINKVIVLTRDYKDYYVINNNPNRRGTYYKFCLWRGVGKKSHSKEKKIKLSSKEKQWDMHVYLLDQYGNPRYGSVKVNKINWLDEENKLSNEET